MLPSLPESSLPGIAALCPLIMLVLIDPNILSCKFNTGIVSKMIFCNTPPPPPPPPPPP